MEKKWLMISVIALVAGLIIGAIFGHESRTDEITQIKYSRNGLQYDFDELETEYGDLLIEHEALHTEYDTLSVQFQLLNTTYLQLMEAHSRLKKHSFTYYVEGNAISISNVTIIEKLWGMGYTVNGTLTNISNKPIETVLIYLNLRNPDGTADLTYSLDYERIDNLYVGESGTFEFYSVYIDEGQTIEFLLIY